MRDAQTEKFDPPVPFVIIEDVSESVENETDSTSSVPDNKLLLSPATMATDDNYFDLLKQTTARLNLNTRRPSYVAWREKYLEKPISSRRPYTIHEAVENEDLTPERKNRIDESLDWIRHELSEMRSQDKLLACQLLALRKDIHQYKLQKGQREHEELLDDVQADYEELHELSELCDMPMEELGLNNTPLKHLGVTRLNLYARRFSTC